MNFRQACFALLLSLALGLAAGAPVSAQDQSAGADAPVDPVFVLGDSTARNNRCSELANARPCTVKVNVSIPGCAVRFTSFSVRFDVSYTGFGRNDKSSKTHNWSGNACQITQSWPISDDVRAGDVLATLSYQLSNGRTGTKTDRVTVSGSNPGKDAVRNQVGNLTYSVVFFIRSQLEQFDAAGAPKLGQGFGIGAIVTPGIPELWNWKANVRAATGGLDVAFRIAREQPQRMRAAGFGNLPDFTPEQLKLQALQLMVGEVYFRPTPDGRGWRPAPNLNPFAETVIRIEKEIAAGKPPAGW